MMKRLTLFLLALTFALQGWGQVQMDRINATGVNSKINPTRFQGADIGAQVNAAFASAACANAFCPVEIPAGNYTQTTTITYPNIGDGKARITIDKGAVITYTGTGCSISLLTNGTIGNGNIQIDGDGEIVGTSAGTAGICLAKGNGGNIGGIYIRGFSNGAAIKNTGYNTLEISRNVWIANKYGYWGIGSGDGWAPNAVNIHDTLVESNTAWGVFLDGSADSGGGGPQQNVTLNHVTFELNGTNGNNNTGQLFIQTGLEITIKNSYFEYDGTNTIAQSIVIGDGSHLPSNVKLKDNFFVSPGTSSSVLSRCFGLQAEGNTELTPNTNFINHTSLGGSTSDGTIIGRNYSNSANTIGGGGFNNIDLLIDQINNRILTMYTMQAAGFVNGAVTTNGLLFNGNDTLIRSTIGSHTHIQDGSGGDEFVCGDDTCTSSQPLVVTNSKTFTLAQTTVGSLPSAASNPGAMILVTDSTAVASEGQTCVGSSTNKALAVSNGSVWKCF